MQINFCDVIDYIILENTQEKGQVILKYYTDNSCAQSLRLNLI